MFATLSPANKDLFETFLKLNLPKGKYVIFGSGGLLIRNLKEGHDLDIIVTPDIYEEYRTKEGWKLKPCNGDFYLSKDGMELWENWKPGVWNVDELIAQAEYIEGLAFVPLQKIAEWKRLSGREKDLEHAKIIDEYLAASHT